MSINANILSVSKFLENSNLAIPEYQRPYKWSSKNVKQLLQDIVLHSRKSSYRIGTIVLHKDNELYNIVDGQQRTLTLILIIRAIAAHKLEEIRGSVLRGTLNQLKDKIIDPEFNNHITQFNLYKNYVEIERIVSKADFTEEHIEFLLNKCELITFVLNNISEAFQFFDSQNARGKDLAPHDLLKAFHLREFSTKDEKLKLKTVEKWENTNSQELEILFSNYLFRIKQWIEGKSAIFFSKENISAFKGLHVDNLNNYPSSKHLNILNSFVDHYNLQYERDIDMLRLNYPFQISQTITNGRRFFEMITHYYDLTRKDANTDVFKIVAGDKLDDISQTILATLSDYEGKWRTGDKYTKNLFDCLLLVYIDKFGLIDISSAIEKTFIWAYSIRLKQQVLQFRTVDNYASSLDGLFSVLRNATSHLDFLIYELPHIEKVLSTKTKKIEEIFINLKYLKAYKKEEYND